MKKLLLTALSFLALTIPGRSEPRFDYDRPTVKTVINNGSPRSHVDLVFVGDGYTELEQRQFDDDVKAASEYLWGFALFRDYKSYFNIHSVFVPSVREGSQFKYAFGSEMSKGQQGFVEITKRQEVARAANKAPAADVVVVITTLGGRAHASGMVVLPGRSFQPLAHELGHAIGKLGDEYQSTSSLADRGDLGALESRSRDLGSPNLTLTKFIDPKDRDTIRKTAKWGHFLDLPDSFPLVSAYQGGGHQSIGVWRPTYTCVMNTNQAPFCPVCHEAMVQSIYRIAGIGFDDASYHRRHPLTQWK